MEGVTAAPPAAAKAARRNWTFGPGLVFVLAAVGPQDLVSNAAAGSGFGYSLLWMLIVVVAARFVILETSARYVLVTGESLMAGYARRGRWVVWVFLVSIFIKRHLSGLYQILLIGAAVHLLIPLPTGHSAKIWSVVFWLLGFALMYWGRYRGVEKCSKPLIMVLGGALVVAAIFSKPDLGGVVRGLFIPSIPQGYGSYSYPLVLMALVGAGAGSLSNLKYSAFVRAKGWQRLEFLRFQRRDLLVSVAALFVMLALVQIAAAGTLASLGVELDRIEDLVPLFSASLGAAGGILMAIGLWASVFTTYVGANTGYSLLAVDILENQLGKRSDDEDRSKFYRLCLIWFCFSPVYVLFTDWEPVALVLVATALQTVVLPVVVLVLMWITNDRKLMGDHANGWLTNGALALITATALYLTIQNAREFLAG